jgi:integrase
MTRQDSSKARQRKRKLSPEAAKWLPYPEFPLSPHLPSGRWYKVHKGKRHYFGPLNDWEAALKRYEREWPQIIAGRKPRPEADEQAAGLTLAAGVNEWLAARVEDSEDGTISPSTIRDYHQTAARLVAELGRQTPISWLGPEDFRKLAKAYRQAMSPSQAKKAITITRQIFNWLYQNEHIPAPPRYGTDFKMPKLQSARVDQGQTSGIFTAAQCRAMLRVAQTGAKGERWRPGNTQPKGLRPSPHLRAMLLLALNGGYTQTELAKLELEDVDLDNAIIDHRRAKTEARRTVPLWPETIEALWASLEHRPEPGADAEGLFFVTKQGKPWVREQTITSDGEGGDKLKHKRTDSIRLQFGKVADAAGVSVKGAGFGRLRHTHRTVTDEVGDPHAAMRIMGHDVPGISRHYVRDISAARLRAVAEHVRAWLWPKLATVRQR